MAICSTSAKVSPEVFSPSPTCSFRPKLTFLYLGALLFGAVPAFAQSTQKSWDYSLTIDGFIAPGAISYANPIVTADHNWLHFEALHRPCISTDMESQPLELHTIHRKDTPWESSTG